MPSSGGCQRTFFFGSLFGFSRPNWARFMVVCNTHHTEPVTLQPPSPCFWAFLSCQAAQHPHKIMLIYDSRSNLLSIKSIAQDLGCKFGILTFDVILISFQNIFAHVHSKNA
jgi:hypothetical protein